LGPNAREIGYWIRADHLRQGYATEAAAALTRVAFEVDGIDRVEIHCSPKNLASAGVPRKLGFTHEATLRRQGSIKNGQPDDSMIWTVHVDEYPLSAPATAKMVAFDVFGARLP
jgi:RimJ/RimL family protein N-acetyltransferase